MKKALRFGVAAAVIVLVVVLVLVLGRRGSRDEVVQPGSVLGSASAPKTRSLPALQPTATFPMTAARSVITRGWGTGPGELGRRVANESNPEGPMSIIAANGGLVVLDQVNARIVRLGLDGKPIGSFPIGPDTAQDIAVGKDGRVAVLDRVNEGQLLYYDEQGNLLGQAPVVGGPLTEAGGATGVFVDDGGVYIEREHGELVRVFGPDGRPDPDRPPRPGRPLRDGSGSVQALIADKQAGVATLRVFSPTADLVWQRSIRFPAAIQSLLLLDSDRLGRVYLAAHVGTESRDPPFDVTGERIIVVRLEQSDGADRGSLVIAAPTAPDETLRPLTVGDEGTVYQMVPTEAGVEIRAHSFP